MRRFLKWSDTVLLMVANLFLLCFLISVVLQVFCRYALGTSIPWSEEAGVYLFVWSSFLAAAVIVGMDDHFRISFVVESLSFRGRWIADVTGTLLCLLFVWIMVWKGAVWSLRMLWTLSPVMQLPQGALYAIIPLSGLYMGVHFVVRLTTLLHGFQGRGENPAC
jgi:TRAP-type C4-dicarboxylate transport system permease small subunit